MTASPQTQEGAGTRQDAGRPGTGSHGKARRVFLGWLATAGGAAAVVLALVWLYAGYAPAMNDFEVYYYGGTKVLQAGEAGISELYAPRDGLPFTYPPFAALLFAGLATMSLGQSGQLFIWAALGGAAVVSAWLARHYFGLTRWRDALRTGGSGRWPWPEPGRSCCWGRGVTPSCSGRSTSS